MISIINLSHNPNNNKITLEDHNLSLEWGMDLNNKGGDQENKKINQLFADFLTMRTN